MNDSGRAANLLDYLRVLRQQRLLILAVTLLFGGVALAYSLKATPTYRAEATLLFQEPSSVVDPLRAGGPSRLQPEERAAIGADLVTRPDITRAVLRKLKIPALQASVSAAAESRSNLVVITSESSKPARAAAVANAFASETKRQLTRDYRKQLRDQLKAAAPDFDKIRKLEDPTVRSQQLTLRGQLRALRKLASPVEVARTAGVPAAPFAPHKIRNTLVGLLAGLTLGLVAAFLRSSVDRRLRDLRDVAEAADLPVVGRIGSEALRRGGHGVIGMNGSGTLDLEGIRIARTNLEFLDARRRASTVLVTSPLAEEGKSTVAASLAAANALSGRLTLLVECDLRRPILAERLRIKQGPGLADFLARKCSSRDVLQPVPLPGTEQPSEGEDDVEGTPLLTCVTAGTIPKQPAELLGSEALADFIVVASRAYDTIVLDSSPLLPVVDTLRLVPLADRILVCVRAGRTTHDQLAAARQALSNLPEAPTGVIVTGVKKSDELDYQYYGNRYAGLTSSG